MEREGVVEVSGVAGRAVETEGAAGELGSCAGVVGFCEFDGFVGTPVREAVDEDVAVTEAGVDYYVDGCLEVSLLFGGGADDEVFECCADYDDGGGGE